jgi:hypothetical protein
MGAGGNNTGVLKISAVVEAEYFKNQQYGDWRQK